MPPRPEVSKVRAGLSKLPHVMLGACLAGGQGLAHVTRSLQEGTPSQER